MTSNLQDIQSLQYINDHSYWFDPSQIFSQLEMDRATRPRGSLVDLNATRSLWTLVDLYGTIWFAPLSLVSRGLGIRIQYFIIEITPTSNYIVTCITISRSETCEYDIHAQLNHCIYWESVNWNIVARNQAIDSNRDISGIWKCP